MKTVRISAIWPMLITGMIPFEASNQSTLASSVAADQFFAMSVAQLQNELSKLTAQEKLALAGVGGDFPNAAAATKVLAAVLWSTCETVGLVG